MEHENENKVCLNCDKESSDLVTCDDCEQRVCYSCRHDGYVSDVWVITFCYNCHPELKENRI